MIVEMDGTQLANTKSDRDATDSKCNVALSRLNVYAVTGLIMQRSERICGLQFFLPQAFKQRCARVPSGYSHYNTLCNYCQFSVYPPTFIRTPSTLFSSPATQTFGFTSSSVLQNLRSTYMPRSSDLYIIF